MYGLQIKSGSSKRLISTRPIHSLFAIRRVVVQPLDGQGAIHRHRRSQHFHLRERRGGRIGHRAGIFGEQLPGDGVRRGKTQEAGRGEVERVRRRVAPAAEIFVSAREEQAILENRTTDEESGLILFVGSSRRADEILLKTVGVQRLVLQVKIATPWNCSPPVRVMALATKPEVRRTRPRNCWSRCDIPVSLPAPP